MISRDVTNPLKKRIPSIGVASPNRKRQGRPSPIKIKNVNLKTPLARIKP